MDTRKRIYGMRKLYNGTVMLASGHFRLGCCIMSFCDIDTPLYRLSGVKTKSWEIFIQSSRGHFISFCIVLQLFALCYIFSCYTALSKWIHHNWICYKGANTSGDTVQQATKKGNGKMPEAGFLLTNTDIVLCLCKDLSMFQILPFQLPFILQVF